MKALLLLITVFCFSSIYSQPRYRAHRYYTPTKVVVVKPAKKVKPGKWKNLGSKKVSLKADSDNLSVTGYKGAFTKVKFKTSKAPVYINSMTILFANGEDKHIPLNKNFAEGTASRIIDLPGNQRIIKKIHFDYKTIDTGNGKAKLTVWGMH